MKIDDSILAKYYGGISYDREFIVLHYTANSGTTATARGNANYFASCDRQASAHYVVDEGDTAYKCVPENHIAYAVGGTIYPATKGAMFYGKCGNGNSISIEMVSHSDANGYYIPEKTVDNALTLVRELQARYNIPNDHVIRHYDVNGKPCPWCWTDVQGYDGERLWEAFKARLEGFEPVVDKNTEDDIETPSTTLYRVQVGAFKNRGNAEAMLEEVKALGFGAFIVSVGGLYKIQVGAFKMKANAEKYLEEIKNAGLDGFIVIASADTPLAPYLVKITANILYIREKPTKSSEAVGTVKLGGIYTIVEEQDGYGADKWGKLKSGAGWIALDYTIKI